MHAINIKRKKKRNSFKEVSRDPEVVGKGRNEERRASCSTTHPPTRGVDTLESKHVQKYSDRDI